jgi:uncharacterized protein YkwD
MAHGRRLLLAVSALVLLGVMAASPVYGAPPSPSSRAACDGVQLVSAPYLVTGIGGLVIDISAPLDDLLICQAIDLKRPSSKRGCKDSRVPGFKLRPKDAAASVRCLIDKERAARGLHQLDAQGNLKRAAKRHTAHMVSTGCFAHECPGEPDLVHRVTSAGYLPCTCTWTVGENIAWASRGRSSPAGIVAAWMASPPHREMILTGNMRDVDVGVKAGSPGGNRPKAATYTADFGVKG